jgi:plasmid rolling circle replication initiator protein Rep
MPETHVSDCLQQSDEVNSTIIEKVLLRQVSPRDAKWDDRRAESDRVRELYQGTIFDALAERINGCSGRLEFGLDIPADGILKLKLRSAFFCRVRTCPVCQWRRSLVWRAKAFQFLPKVVEAYPKHRFIFLTLTVKNCQISDLKETLGKMNKAWIRITKRKQWPAVGWIRSVEVTRGQDSSAHPHFHCLLMVPTTYFNGKYYLSQANWTQLWKESMQIAYNPIVHVQAVKPKKNGDQDMLGAILETFKYSIKPSDLIGDNNKEVQEKDREWLIELTSQLHKTRAVATGGILKEYLKDLENEPEDFIHTNEDGEKEEATGISVIFDWQQRCKKYLMDTDE